MTWTNIRILWWRELIDQLRDRRTLFTVAVLPLMLYPLLGILLLQITQFFRERPSHVLLAGVEHLPSQLPFLLDDRIDPRWIDADESRLMELEILRTTWPVTAEPAEESRTTGAAAMSDRHADGVRRLLVRHRAHAAVIMKKSLHADEAGSPEHPLPDVVIYVNSADDASTLAARRIEQALRRWKSALIEANLLQQHVSPQAWQILSIQQYELAVAGSQRVVLWSKVLPLILVLWCLTGAFYPAVDVCAGEKERGTFETLLSSAAVRAEIAWGKLLTVASFSAATALLNLVSLMITALFVAQRLGNATFSPWGNSALPPWSSMLWVLLVIPPIALLLGAVSLAAAAFARSSKEGQYYLVPLIMISMPLMMLTMVPSAQLELGTSLIPITGMMLLLRGLIEHSYVEVLPYVAPVALVTLACVWGSVRWVIAQFNSEAVMFRVSERFGVGLWVRRMLQDRGHAPTIGQAILCFVVILVAKFFLGFSLEMPHNWGSFATQTVTILLAAVAVPAILMAVVLTRSPLHALKLDQLRWPQVAAGALLAIALHPAFTWLSQIVMVVYPASDNLSQMHQLMGQLLAQAPSAWAIFLVIALFPALAEEIAFRGFILSGWQRLRGSWKPILVSAFCFGAAHSVFQQSIMAFGVGVVLGMLALRTGSLIPCIVYHVCHNAMSVAMSPHSPLAIEDLWPLFSPRSADGSLAYAIGPGVLLTTGGAVLLFWLWRQDESHRQSPVSSARHYLALLWQRMRGLAPADRPPR